MLYLQDFSKVISVFMLLSFMKDVSGISTIWSCVLMEQIETKVFLHFS